MALQSAQLANAITANQTSFMLTSAPSSIPTVGAQPLPIGIPMLIDAEFMFVIAQPATNLVLVRGRGTESAAVAHDVLANVYVSSSPGDFPNPQAGTTTTSDFAEDSAISIGQDQTITPAGANAVYNINKTSAAALTLLAPNLADNGVTLVFTSNTAAAHVITATGLIQDGSASVKNTATFSAQKGATVVFVIENGFYNVAGSPQNITLA